MMNPVTFWVAGGIAVASLTAGLAGGYAAREVQGNQRIGKCAESILKVETGDLTISGCPVPIQTAFATVKSSLQTKEIEVRDKIIPIITNDGFADAARNRQMVDDIAALIQEPPTDACSTSPAMLRRREQLLRDEGPEVPADAQGTEATGEAVQL